ncbi:hypothetical protein [Thalassotalea ganghwensis]
MESNNSQQREMDKQDSSPASRSNTRRRLLKSSPALLLLANRPTFAGTCSISGFMSATVGTSIETFDSAACNGWSPGNWKNNSGQITNSAWNMTGVSPSTPFSSIFSTSKMSGCVICRVENGAIVDNIDYSSGIGFSFEQVLDGMIQGKNSAKDITSHAAASYLNAAFIAGGGGGAKPDPWMINYISPTDVIGLYLLYELTHLQPRRSAFSLSTTANASYRYMRNGVTIGDSAILSTTEYASFFVGMADGSGSQVWQNNISL